MPKVKIPRKDISLDMTAMCDMAFLLLTFFMLATKFKAPESVAIDMPSSVSQIKIPGKDMMILSIANDGKVFFGIDGQPYRKELLGMMAEKYNLKFTEEEKEKFSLMENFGIPLYSLKGYLSLGKEDKTKVTQPGIPADSVNNELKDWVGLARAVNPNLMIAIKGDREVNNKVVNHVIGILQDQNINKFNLITTLEGRPEEAKD
jgi:biopolymer transport protein ExbD